MSIYTKKGDKGSTKVFDKKTGNLVEISKMSCKIKAIGAVDELNSFLGMVGSFSKDKKLLKDVREIQENLFTLNSILAGGNLKFSKAKVKRMERRIDEWDGKLPVQKNFIYYGGSEVASLLFYARALVRRTERTLVKLTKLSSSNFPLLTSHILPYMNRLSDYLFIMARKVNFDEEIKEEYWIGKKN